MNVKFGFSFIRMADQARGKVGAHRAIDDDLILSSSTLNNQLSTVDCLIQTADQARGKVGGVLDREVPGKRVAAPGLGLLQKTLDHMKRNQCQLRRTSDD